MIFFGESKYEADFVDIFFNFMLQWFHDIIIPNRQMGYHKLQFYDIVSGDFVLKEHEAGVYGGSDHLTT